MSAEAAKERLVQVFQTEYLEACRAHSHHTYYRPHDEDVAAALDALLAHRDDLLTALGGRRMTINDTGVRFRRVGRESEMAANGAPCWVFPFSQEQNT